MFSADLSWTDPDTEKVGERKERKAREKEKERSISSTTPSLRSSKSSKSSIPDDRELWWTSGLKKARSIKPSKNNRPDTARSATRPRKTSVSVPQALDLDTSEEYRDPIAQPSWTLSASLSPTLPSGASLDPPEYEVPELEGDLSSRCTNSTISRSSHERQWGWKNPGKIKVIDEVYEIQQLSPYSSIQRATSRRSETGQEEEEQWSTPSPQEEKRKRRPHSVRIEGCLDLGVLKLQDHPDEALALPGTMKHASYASGLPDADLVTWRPPSEWDIVLPTTQESTQEKGLPPLPSDAGIAVAHSSTLELSRFQRFIRRMESAGPKIILDRLKEEWNNPVDEEASEELTLEKQLWVLTAFQLQNLGRYSRFPKTNTGKILELYGNLAEVYQLSAMHPRQKVHYLTTKPQQPIPLPGNVSYLTVPQPGVIPFPYQDASFSHIRASTLPSLVPSSQLPQIFRECHRLLAPGGMLEIRIMDAAPVRKTAGPKMKAWIEDRLSLNLEKLFRCSKPCTLVPSWVSDAGFDLPTTRPSEGDENVRLRCAFAKSSSDVEGELSTLVGRALWRDLWGGFVDDVPDEPRWWWDDEEVMQECLERKTVFECGAIFAFKKGI